MIWYPYTPLKSPPPFEVSFAKGVYLYLSDGRQLLDGISSWWSVVHGYNHPRLNQALQDQMQAFSHVMLGGLTHQRAIQLADLLIGMAPAGFERVFFADSGSVGVEVALKLCLQYWHHKKQPQKKQFLCLKNAYHGDTFAAMAVCDPEEGMHQLFAPVLPTIVLPSPADVSLDEALDSLAGVLKKQASKIAGFIFEPLLQAAGGMKVYEALYLTRAKALCDQYDVLMIADEVATGFGRTGTVFACEQAQISPDVMVLGKALTAGYLGHSAVLVHGKICRIFDNDDPKKALMHGPTFMGNPLACAVAVEGIKLFKEGAYLQKIAQIEAIFSQFIPLFDTKKTKRVTVKGAMIALEFYHDLDVYAFQHKALQKGIWLRPFGRIVYVMPAYVMSLEEVRRLVEGVLQIVQCLD